ncbi:hypothetical protein AGDE_10864 [Angomonas deanei]|nr:hypothetical protein AGDE_10864 [Angomonas deanei]|eukprot:EPY27241.1 hypothetical protein AGDE_10864 [Angomonas deanei]
MPRLDKTPVEQQFKKPVYTQEGINKRQDDVNTEPLMYVETSKDGSGTEITDHSSPRWYLNTYMEMSDNMRKDRVVISGNLPASWERDKHEPYSLVRGRIDDEDLAWVLNPENRKKPIDELVKYTKLDRQVLQDILDTVEVPRTQYRNYKGKLHKSIDNANVYMESRKAQLEKSRETEILRQIGYSDEDIAKEEQYLTNRSRGQRTLDDLGASVREKKRQEYVNTHGDLEDMLEQRRIEQIEQGNLTFLSEDEKEEMTERPDRLQSQYNPRAQRNRTYKRMYRADMGDDDFNEKKFQWWMDRTRRIKRAVDTIHGVPIYNERLSANEEQTRKQMREAAEFNMSVSRSQGAKGFTDPRGHFDQFYSILKDQDPEEPSVHVEEGDAAQHDIFRFPHTKEHSANRTAAPSDRHDRAEPIDTDISKLYGESEEPTTKPTTPGKDDGDKK